MSLSTTVIGNVMLGVMALSALMVVWGRPLRFAEQQDAKIAALERLERECELRAAWTNPHARPRGRGEPVGERRIGDYPRLRLVSTATGEHVREAPQAS
jgi:hypothetical protein